MSKNIVTEAKAFDSQILDRIKNGHIPDLRQSKRNEWFYNNVWRDPEYLKMTVGKDLEIFLKYLKPESNILEIGCGPGYFSLELARSNHHVTGVDLSPDCIKLAKKTSLESSSENGFGSLNYLCGDFNSLNLNKNHFDAVVFYGALSHFPDIEITFKSVCTLLSSQGRIFVYDTSKDLYDKGDAAIFYLLSAMLSVTGHYFENVILANGNEQLTEQIDQTLKALQYVDDEGHNLQSPNDSSQTYNSTMNSLKSRFRQLYFSWESSFSKNIIGGIRSKSVDEEIKIAKFIRLLEKYLIDNGKLNPAFYLYVGEKI